MKIIWKAVTYIKLDFKNMTFEKTMKMLGILAVIVVYALIVFRSIVRFEADIYDTLIHNAKVRDAFTVEEPFAYKFSVPEIEKNIGIGKVITVANVYYSPQVRQLQLCVKYNSGVAQAPTDSRIPFEFALHDTLGNTYTDYYFRTDQRYGSRYIRVCFENVEYDISENKEFKVDVTKKQENLDTTIPETTSFDFTLEADKKRKVKYNFDW